ncbi:MAG TPA: histidine kinase N-terminal 7TM domain-containing protein, partial [Anaerolineales bacterium]
MNIDITIAALIILGAAIIIAAVARSRLNNPGAESLLVMALAIGLWAIAYLVRDNYRLAQAEPLEMAVVYLSILVAASAQFTFALAYSNRMIWRTRLVILLLAVLPVLTQLFFWINPIHSVFFQDTNPNLGLLPLNGTWARVVALYMYSLAGASVLLILDVFSRKPRPLLLRAWTIPVSSGLVFLIQLLLIIGFHIPLPIDASLIAFTLAGIGFSYGLFNQSLIESIPITREVVVQGMNEGWMVVDDRNIIVDINPAAERMIGISREKAYGQSIHSILGDVSNLGSTFEGVQELEMKRSFRSQESGWRYLNIRISPLSNEQKEPFGHLIVWRDITERRMAEDARQRARDEMFVLLSAISSEASQAESLEEFLTESIYQFIYQFHSQVVAIFLTDEKRDLSEEQRFFLTSHFGLSQAAADSMPSLSLTSPLFGLALKEREPMMIEGPEEEHLLPASLRDSGCASLLVVPLSTQAGDGSKTLGCMCIGRKEKPNFSQDEIVRLSTISDHLANLIDSDRRRKLAIALTERQRLMRDLHDSVSQKLNGVVIQTEAAQAGLEAGNHVDMAAMLAKIGDHARQAVKEMRLFLYQMQTV